MKYKKYPRGTSKKKIFFLNEDSLRVLWNNIKYIHIHTIGVPERKSEQGIENLFEEIMTENISNLVKETHTTPGSTESQTRLSQRVPHQDKL